MLRWKGVQYCVSRPTALPPNGSTIAASVLVVRSLRELCGHEIADQQQHTARIHGQHLASQRGKREEDRGGKNQVRDDEREIRLKISQRALRPDARRIEPRHVRASPRSQAYAGENHRLHSECAQKTSAQVVELGNGRGVEKCCRVIFYVLVSCLAGQRRAHDHSKETDVHDDEIQREGRGDQHSSARAEVHGGIRECASRHQHEEEAQSEKHEEIYVGGDAAQALRKLECQDGSDHGSVHRRRGRVDEAFNGREIEIFQIGYGGLKTGFR